MEKYVYDLSDLDLGYLKTYLGRIINNEEAIEVIDMAKRHIDGYIADCLVWNSGIAEKLILWKKVEVFLKRNLTSEERNIISKCFETQYIDLGIEIEDTQIMDIIKSWK